MPGDTEEAWPIVSTERGPRGGYLAFIDAEGARAADLTRLAGDEVILDRSPAFSPDGGWVVFASTRGRASLAKTSLWIVEARPGAEPRRVTFASGVDRDPVWAPDGRSIVFSSSRAGRFDLYELELELGPDGVYAAAAEPSAITHGPAHALSPSISPSGDIVFMALDERAETTSLWIVGPARGEPRALTSGPRDMTPAFSPSGAQVAFAAPVEGRGAADIFVIDAGGGTPEPVFDEPLADQTGPAYSADGRYVFATAVYRSVATAEPILSSVVYVDLEDPARVVRALHDPVAIESRVGVAVRPAPLPHARLAANLPYAEALRDAVFRELRREQRELEGGEGARVP